MHSLKSPCTNSYRSSIDTIALHCLVFEKLCFCMFASRSKMADLCHLGFYGSHNGLFEKPMCDFLRVINRQHSSKLLSFWANCAFCILVTDKQTNKQMDTTDALSCSRYRQWQLNNKNEHKNLHTCSTGWDNSPTGFVSNWTTISFQHCTLSNTAHYLLLNS